ncbi:MAG: hypothetical protein HEQ32_04905 [Vampirovibrio sp.]
MKKLTSEQMDTAIACLIGGFVLIAGTVLPILMSNIRPDMPSDTLPVFQQKAKVQCNSSTFCGQEKNTPKIN